MDNRHQNKIEYGKSVLRDGEHLNIIVHYPKNEQDLQTLQKKVASVHADAVIHYLQKLTCPEIQKLKLHNEIKQACHDKR